MILIDIDMPDNCDECRFNTEYAFCKAMPDNFCGNTDDRKRPKWCPLKEKEQVKCGDCIFYDANCQQCVNPDGIVDGIIFPSWYCADGERKEND